MNKSKCMDWRADFSADEAEETQEYFVYFKFFRQKQPGNMPARRVRRFVQRLLTGEIRVDRKEENYE